MSLINEVLRDLDKRHAPENERAGVPNEVRPLPAPAQSIKRPLLLPAMLLILSALIAIWWLYQQTDESIPAHVPTPPQGTSAPTAVSPAPTSGVTEQSQSPLATPAPVTKNQSDLDVDRELVSEFSGLKFATSLSLPKAQEAEATQARTVPQATRPDESGRAEGALQKTPTAPGGGAAAGPATAPLPSVTVANPAKAPAASVGGQGSPSVPPASPPTDDWAKAQALLRSANPGDAEPLLKKLLEIQPGSTQMRQAMINLLLGQRRYAEAIPVLKVGLARQPEQTAWAMNLARLHVESGDYASAWEALSVGLPRAQQQADYLAFAGTILQRLDRPVEAAMHYQAALRLRPDEARWWVGLGISLESSNQSADARAAFQRAKGIGGFSAEMGRFIDQKLQ